ncbi:GGDEF domain-containing protein [Neobacillus dielmonensis]|uniref:GGDEF domain-containing protein n=1 Tax=Neobacillus dielmonensis TaxID=1347369 RepID=UPI000693ADA1|nr:GGDEF domain-containing protein [Neobacillus dielmonensis]
MKWRLAFSIPQVSRDKQLLLKKHIFTENLKRCKLFASIVILFEIILIMMNLSSDHGKLLINTYLILYFLLLGMSILMLIYIHWFEKKSSYTERQYRWFNIGILSFVNFFLVWGAAVTLVDQKSYGHVMAFVVNFMCVSILFHASNRTILMIYIPSILVLLIGLPVFQHSEAILLGHYVNLSVFIFFCWLASRMLYISNSTNFLNEWLLTETNENLAAKNAEIERINRELADVNIQLKKMAVLDELTKVPNRRGFQQYIQEWLTTHQSQQTLTIMMLDIDAFKLFNDHYGHLEGDKIIELVAQAIQNCMASSAGITARYGGEEFVIAVFDTANEDVYRLAEKIRATILEMGIPHEFSPVANRVTASIGYASGEVSNEDEIQELVEMADRALYKSKSKGRNRVEGISEGLASQNC